MNRFTREMTHKWGYLIQGMCLQNVFNIKSFEIEIKVLYK
mgnify:CR=1 FL=1